MGKDEKALKTIDTIAKLMDSQFRIPGTDFRFGLDAIAGLLPVGGDAASFLASGALILAMVRHGASPMLALKMLGNVALDALLGAVPILGDLFDVVYKANNRNVKLLKEFHESDQRHRGSVWPLLIAVFIALLAIGAALSWLLYQVAAFLFSFSS